MKWNRARKSRRLLKTLNQVSRKRHSSMRDAGVTSEKACMAANAHDRILIVKTFISSTWTFGRGQFYLWCNKRNVSWYVSWYIFVYLFISPRKCVTQSNVYANCHRCDTSEIWRCLYFRLALQKKIYMHYHLLLLFWQLLSSYAVLTAWEIFWFLW